MELTDKTTKIPKDGYVTISCGRKSLIITDVRKNRKGAPIIHIKIPKGRTTHKVTMKINDINKVIRVLEERKEEMMEILKNI